MNKYSAVYYPHTSMRSGELLKNSLLLWDFVDCIVPWGGFSLTEELKGPQAEAAELLLRARTPENDNKKSVDDSITDLFRNGTPTWIAELTMRDAMRLYGHRRRGDHPKDYLVYPSKLMGATWDKLSELDLAHFTRRYMDYAVPPALGLLLMSELANSMAGETQHTITDRSEAYACLFSVMTSTLGGEMVLASTPEIVSSTIDRLVTISVKSVDTDKVKFKRILDLRKREAKEGATDFRTLRHKYLDEVVLFSQAITKPQLSANDRSELTRQFADKIEADFQDLKKELGMARTDVFFSKEAGVAALALAGGLAGPVQLGVSLATAVNSIGVGALINVARKYTKARRESLAKHCTSWLFLSSEPSLFSRFLDS